MIFLSEINYLPKHHDSCFLGLRVATSGLGALLFRIGTNVVARGELNMVDGRAVSMGATMEGDAEFEG